MYTRMQNYSEKELTRIHDASLDLLKNTDIEVRVRKMK